MAEIEPERGGKPIRATVTIDGVDYSVIGVIRGGDITLPIPVSGKFQGVVFALCAHTPTGAETVTLERRH